MRLGGLCVVGNEGDFVEFFIRHNVQFLDFIGIMDNSSTGGYRAILTNLVSEGLRIVVFDAPPCDLSPAKRITQLWKNARRFFDPDYFFFLHTSDFIVAESRRCLETDLLHMPENRCSYMSCKTQVVSDENALPETVLSFRMHQPKNVQIHENYRVILPRGVEDRHETMLLNALEQATISGSFPPNSILEESYLASPPIRSRSPLTKGATELGADCGVTNLRRTKENTSDSFTDILMKKEFSSPDFNGWPGNIQKFFADRMANQLHFKPAPLDSSVGNKCPQRQKKPSSSATLFPGTKAMGQPSLEANSIDSAGGSHATTQPKGALGPHFHVENFFMDIPPFKYIADRYLPESVLDLGCGLGGYLRVFKELGVQDVLGIDGFEPRGLFLCGNDYMNYDLSEPLTLNKTFSLVMCIEVVEHIEERYERIVMENMLRHAQNLILFSAARPSQPGRNHVNCRPLQYWIKLWEEYGWVPSPFESLAFRSLATFFWLRRNPVILRPKQSCSSLNEAFNEDDLEGIEVKRLNWVDQKPNIYVYPLSENPYPLKQ